MRADDLALGTKEVERVRRAASGAAHGMYWVNLDLMDTTVGEEYEARHFRLIAIPELPIEALGTANKVAQYAALKFLLYSGADITALIANASRCLAKNLTPIDPDAEGLRRPKDGRMPRKHPRSITPPRLLGAVTNGKIAVMDLGATAEHERRKLEVVEAATASYDRALAEMERARNLRDRAVRAAVSAGVPSGRVAEATGLSLGRVSRIVNAPTSS